MAFLPYLFFGGNCRQAFTRYQEIFGGDLELMAVGDAPGGEDVPADQKDTIIHAALMFEGHLLMATDDLTTDSFGPVQGMMVSCSPSDVDEARRVFDALSEGGEVRQELTETFFSPAFGMCVDRFGTPWMVSAEPAEPAEEATGAAGAA